MTAPAPAILVVDDDADLARAVARYLAEHEFRVVTAGDGRAMDRAMAEAAFDLVILDVGLPGEDGLAICRRLRDGRGPSVIMASAAGAETDRVLGLELGADDYLAKPFSPRELLARVRAVLRRRGEPDDPEGGYRFEGFTYRVNRRELTAPGGALVLLTAGEAQLLETFLRRPRMVLTREALAPGSDPDSRALDLQVSRLRRKLETHGAGETIRTQRGLGYVLDCLVSRT